MRWFRRRVGEFEDGEVLPVPTLTQSGGLSRVSRWKQAAARSSTWRNSRRGVPVPQMVTEGSPRELRLVEAADEGGDDVGVFRVVVVAGAVEVGGHGAVVEQAVLGAVVLAELEAGDLGDGVGFVGGLERAGEQAVLGHRLGRQLRVDAGRAEEQDAGHPARREPSTRLAAMARFS
jgi:hypothetical protein